MSDKPYFPKSKPREPYREVATRPLYAEPAKPAVAAPKPRAAARAPEPEERVPSFAEVRRDERLFWRKESFLARHPRPFALVVAVIGGLVTRSSVAVLLYGGRYSVKATLGAPVFLLAGLWALVFGWPVRLADGRTPDWWVLGLGISAVCGVVMGIALTYLLGQSSVGWLTP